MDESNFGYRWGVPKQLNCQMCDIRVWVEIWLEFPKISKETDLTETRFFQGILYKHITQRILKPFLNSKHENVQNGKISVFP
jgi:hypothetical protein